MKKLLQTTAVLCLVGMAWAAQEPQRVGVGVIERKLSVTDALELALKNNLEIEIERTNVATSREALRAAQGAFDFILRYQPGIESRNTPTSSVLAAASGKIAERFHNQNFSFLQQLPWHGTSMHVDFLNGRQSTNNPFVGLNPFITSQLVVGFTQPLLRNRENDRQRSEIKIRSKQIGISEVDVQLRVIDIATRVLYAYWDLVEARQDVKVKGAFVEWAREQVARNKRMIEAGTLAPVELSAAIAELERRLDTYYSAVGHVTEVENALKTLLASSRHDEIWKDILVPTDDKAPNAGAADDVNAALGTALKQRPELRQLLLRRETNDIQKVLAENERKPQVNLVANYINSGLAGTINPTDNPFSAANAALYARVNQLSGTQGLPPLTGGSFGGVPPQFIGGYGQTLSGLFGGNYQSVQVGLQLDWNPRNRTADANIAQTVLAERRIKLVQAQTEQAIEAQVRNSLQAIETARQRIVAAEASAAAAKEKMESETRLFQTGESTNFLVLTRQNEYADSLNRVVVAQADLNKALARLQQSVGTILQTYNLRVQ
ncbi:MAG: TolC family protein [Bryobacterales bacterium]|nr:TolC family protein [Bryobacterales bacterium]